MLPPLLQAGDDVCMHAPSIMLIASHWHRGYYHHLDVFRKIFLQYSQFHLPLVQYRAIGLAKQRGSL